MKAYPFSFTLALAISNLPESLEYQKGAETGIVDINGAVTFAMARQGGTGGIQFTLEHGEEITFSGIPYGIAYEIIETNASSQGYTVNS